MAARLYLMVIEEVLTNVRDFFLENGGDDEMLLELKQLWIRKLANTKAFAPVPAVLDARRIVQSLNYQRRMGSVPINRAIHLQSADFVRLGNNIRLISIPKIPKTESARSGASGSPPNQVYRGPPCFQPNRANVLQPTFSREAPTQSLSAAPLQTSAPVTQEKEVALPRSRSIVLPSENSRERNGIDSSSEEEESDESGDSDKSEGQVLELEEPLNSDDDVNEVEPVEELYDIDNVIVCKFEKVHHIKKRWKFRLMDGIMNVRGRDYVFVKMTGEAVF